MSTVLVVQSDSELNDGWCLALETSGHTVLAARGASDGLERVREGGIDVIVLDTNGSAGAVTSFVDELQQLPDAPPFVLVSSSPEVPEMSARLGASAFLPKPCTAADLEATVERLSPRVRTGRIFGEIEDEPTEPRGPIF